MKGLDPSKKMRDVRTIHFHPFSRRELRRASENFVFRWWNEARKCAFESEMRSENVAFVSENKGPDLGMPLPDGPPSSDCPVGWHADGAPRRTRVPGRGSRPVLAQNQGVRVPIPPGAFYAPKSTPQGFSVTKNTDFVRKT